MAFFDRTKKAWRGSVIVNGRRRTKLFRHPGERGRPGRKGRLVEKGHMEAIAWEDRQRLTSRLSTNLYHLMQAFLTQKELEVSRNTYVEYRTCLANFYNWCSKESVGDVFSVDTDLCRRFLSCRALSVSKNAYNDSRQKLANFFKWLFEEKGIPVNPMLRIKPLAICAEKRPKRLVDPRDILKVIMAADGQIRRLLQAYWLSGGARKSEILRWTWSEDINFEKRWVRLGTMKSRGGQMVYKKVYMNDDLFRALMDQWRARHPSSPWVWTYRKEELPRLLARLDGSPIRGSNLHKIVRALCDKAGVRPFTPHDIRHSVAHYLADEQKLGIKRVQEVLRHMRQSTTEIYLDGSYLSTRDEMTLLEFAHVEGGR